MNFPAIEPLLGPVSPDQPTGHDGRSPVDLTGGGRALTGFPTIDGIRERLRPTRPGSEIPWSEVRRETERLLTRGSKHLEAGLIWTLASLHLDGLAGLAAGLALMNELLDRYWEGLHPLPEAGDPYERLQLLSELGVAASEASGEYRVLQRLQMRPFLEGSPWTMGQVLAAMNSNRWQAKDPPALSVLEKEWSALPDGKVAHAVQSLNEATSQLHTIREVWGRRTSGAWGEPSLREMEAVLEALSTRLTGLASPAPAISPDAPSVDEGNRSNALPTPGIPEGVRAVRARRASALGKLESVYRFVSLTEPSNPAIPMLQWALELQDRSLPRLLEDLGPMKLAQLRKLLGIKSQEIPATTPTSAGEESTTPKVEEPIRDRGQILPLLEQVALEFQQIDPSSPVLTLVDFAKVGFSLRYSDLCVHLNGENAGEYARFLGEVGNSSTANETGSQ